MKKACMIIGGYVITSFAIIGLKYVIKQIKNSTI